MGRICVPGSNSEANWMIEMKNSKHYQQAVSFGYQLFLSRISRLCATAMGVALLGSTAQAADRYWDIDGATAGSGPDTTPDGTWNNTTANWSTSAAGDVAT